MNVPKTTAIRAKEFIGKPAIQFDLPKNDGMPSGARVTIKPDRIVIFEGDDPEEGKRLVTGKWVMVEGRLYFFFKEVSLPVIFFKEKDGCQAVREASESRSGVHPSLVSNYKRIL